MLIPINLPFANSNRSSSTSSQISDLPYPLARLGSDQIVLIELQGKLEVEGDPSNGFVGVFKIDEKDRPSLRIGHHLLEGKIVNLPKPFAVLVRSSRARSASAAPSHHSSSSITLSDPHLKNVSTPSVKPSAALVDEEDAAPSGLDVEYDVVAIVKKKIVFGKRPTPIVGPTTTNVKGESSSTSTGAPPGKRLRT